VLRRVCAELGFAVLVALAAGVQAACSGGADRPTHVIDGSKAGPPPVGLEDVGHAIVARATRVGPTDVVDPSVAACLAAAPARPRSPAVWRIGVEGTSVTFATASGYSLVACDGLGPGASWCGRAFGRVRAGRLVDPRVDLAGCLTPDGEAVAFAWVESARRTRYVALRQDGYYEVYPVRGDLPIRIASTRGIDLETSSASFEISEYDAAGRTLRAYTLQARVSG
jgi:hypothetical protein